jgi:hypothetical protein
MIWRIKQFIKSLSFHILRGLPKSTQNEINDRYNICLSCDRFENNQCLECGCNINNKKIFLNKLAWSDQECPLQKWSAINRNKQ